jgi:hypothetical protein
LITLAAEPTSRWTATSGWREANTTYCGPGSSPPVRYETLKNNQITYVHGNGARLGIPGCTTGVQITGGESQPGCNLSNNTVSGNYRSGTDGVQSANIMDGILVHGISALYLNNSLRPHCYCMTQLHSC